MTEDQVQEVVKLRADEKSSRKRKNFSYYY
jgi:hypothetical protein